MLQSKKILPHLPPAEVGVGCDCHRVALTLPQDATDQDPEGVAWKTPAEFPHPSQGTQTASCYGRLLSWTFPAWTIARSCLYLSSLQLRSPSPSTLLHVWCANPTCVCTMHHILVLTRNLQGLLQFFYRKKMSLHFDDGSSVGKSMV